MKTYTYKGKVRSATSGKVLNPGEQVQLPLTGHVASLIGRGYLVEVEKTTDHRPQTTDGIVDEHSESTAVRGLSSAVNDPSANTAATERSRSAVVSRPSSVVQTNSKPKKTKK